MLPPEEPECFRDLYLFGGPVRPVTQTTSGPVRFHVSASGTEHAVRCDLAFIAVGGVTVDDGYTTSNLEDAAMMRDVMERAARVAVLADSSKFGRRLFAQVAEPGRADWFISDAEPPAEPPDAFRRGGVSVLTPGVKGCPALRHDRCQTAAAMSGWVGRGPGPSL